MMAARNIPDLADAVIATPSLSVELMDTTPAVNVDEAEYRRLLGYPQGHIPGERAMELSAWARQWYAEFGQPWVYLREANLQVANDALRIDGTLFQSKQLHDHLLQAGAQRAILVAVSAGRACEEHARRLWEDSKPDEYFFLEMYGSAVVEHLMATMSGRICDLAEPNGFVAVPHYSPGYTGWDIADQNKLFDLIARGLQRPLPEPLEVMVSGMLRPKKSLLAVVGLALNSSAGASHARVVPCENCSFSPCNYRRLPYRHASILSDKSSETEAPASPITRPTAPLTRDAKYSVNTRALRKWAQERVKIEQRDDGSILATFRFDGTTCSSNGHPLAFEYVLSLSSADNRYTIGQADCRPVAGDEGHTYMCAYLNDADTLMEEIAAEKPLLGQPLDDVLNWTRTAAPAGCYCTAVSRAHKWGLALEAIHFTLAQTEAGAAPSITP
jgi:hypothetical protein